MEKQNKKNIKTWYNRFEMMTLFVLCEQGYSDGYDVCLSFNELNKITEEKFKFGENSLAMHIRSLFRRGFLNLKSIDTDDLDIENIKGAEIFVSDMGMDVFYLLKDIKYQSIYKNKRKFKEDGDLPQIEKHSRTFYNRHSLYLLMSIFNNGVKEYKNDKDRGLLDVEFENYVGSGYTFEDILSIVGKYSEKSTDLHIKYLLERELLEARGKFYHLTDFGIKFSKVLKDIKYQSIYNSSRAKIVKN